MTEQVLQWISLHPEWSLLLVFSIAFLESLVIVGLLVPGWVLLVGVGVLIGHGELPFLEMASASFVGAVLGESVSYYLGWHYRDKIHHWSWFKKHPLWLEKSQQFFIKHGAASVAFGRFFGPMRALVPLIAGASNMPPMRFSLINLLSALVWAPVYLFPGILVGAAFNIPQAHKNTLLILLTSMVIFSWLHFGYLKQIGSYLLDKNHHKESLNSMVYLKASLSLICVVLLGYLLTHGSVSHTFSALLQTLLKLMV